MNDANADRDAILSALPSPIGGEPPSVFVRIRPRLDPQSSTTGWEAFDEAFVGLGGQIVPAEALALLLRRGGVWADDDVLQYLPKIDKAASVWDAEIGVCLADLAIAETGTLLISAGPGRSRMTSLAPCVNVVLVHEASIVETPEDAFAGLPKETCVLVSGTSRTSDIEGILIRGVHGPREVYLVKI